MTRILVTGSEGFIPHALVNALVRAGHEVTGTDLFPKEAVEATEYRYVQGDIRRFKDVVKAAQNAEVVYHLAAVSNLNIAKDDPLMASAVNVGGTANLAEVCRSNGAKLIFASSLHVYGSQSRHPVTESSIPKPSEIYAASKFAAEEILTNFGITSTILRLGTTYGPGMRKELAVWIFLSKALNGDDITVFSPGTQVRQPVYIDDLVQGFLSALKPEAENQTINLPGSEGISMLSLARLCTELTGGESQVKLGPPRHTDITFEFVSYEKAKYLLDWEPQTPIRGGLSQTLSWIRRSNPRPAKSQPIRQ